MNERQNRGRASGGKLAGEQHPNARLTADKVRQIRVLKSVGELSETEIGRQFGISQGHVHNIVTGKRWK